MKNKITQRQFGMVSGISLVIMTIVAGMVMGGVYAPVFKMNSEQLIEVLPEMRAEFLWGSIGWGVILLCDLLVSWGLYRFYEPKNNRRAMVMGGLRFIYSLILGIAIIELIRAQFIFDGKEVYTLLQSFQSIWQLGLIIFGFHLLYLAGLVCEKNTLQKGIGILLFAAGIGYVISNIADLFITDYEQLRERVEVIFLLPMVFGEFGLAIWLIAKGGKKLLPGRNPAFSNSTE